MAHVNRTTGASLIVFAALSLASSAARAGGSPINVMVVYSADDSEAKKVADHYASARSLPPGHLCGLAGFTPAETTIDVARFLTGIQAPLDACLADLPEPDRIDMLVLVRGLPYSVTLPFYAASLQAVIQVGHTKDANGMEVAGQPQSMMSQATIPNPAFPQNAYFNTSDSPIMNQYSGWYALGDTIVHRAMQPAGFHRAAVSNVSGFTFKGNVFIVQSLDGFDYKDATDLVDRAVASDGTMPSAEILCMRGEDDARAARDPECELVTRMLAGAGLPGKFVDPFDGALQGHNVAAYFTGSADTVKNAIAGNTFVPGAITDNLTSYGAGVSNFFCSPDGMTCPASESQTSIARFVRAGATGTHGTVNEPLNNVFPNAGAMLLYTFGYSMGESYFYNQRFLYWQNIILGDPLATPYAVRPKVTFSSTSSQPINVPLTIKATHPDGVAAVEVFLAGKSVGMANGDTIDVMLPPLGKPGDALDLMAVATANNAPVMRPGWPVPNQKPRPDVQGWASATVTLGPPQMGETVTVGSSTSASGAGGGAAAGAGGGPGDSGGGSSSGCSCETAGNQGDRWGWLALIAAGGLMRRRRR